MSKRRHTDRCLGSVDRHGTPLADPRAEKDAFDLPLQRCKRTVMHNSQLCSTCTEAENRAHVPPNAVRR